MRKITFKPQNILTLILFFYISIAFAQVGINTTDPKSTLDVNGALSLREGSALNLQNGDNVNIDLGSTVYSQYRITGPTEDFNILSFLSPAGTSAADGQLLTLINTTNHTMKMVHNQGSNGNPQRRIYCAGERDFVLNGKNAVVTLQYNTSESRWIVISHADTNYGANISSVKGTTNTFTDSSSYEDMNAMNITFTPNHSTVYVTFSASGYMDATENENYAKASYAVFRLLNVTANNRVEVGTTTMVTDYNDNYYYSSGIFFGGIFGGNYNTNNTNAAAWNASIGMFPVSVTPGVLTTLKIQWCRGGVSPNTLRCDVESAPDYCHRNLTIYD